MKTRNIRWGVLGATAAVALSAFAPVAARADEQSQKNLMRNLAIGAGALGIYGLANHNSTLGLLGIAGAAVAGNQYEQDRHEQSQDNARNHYYYRHNWNGDNNGYNRDYEYRGNGGDRY